MTDSKTNVQELKEKVREFCEKRDWDQFHGGKELAITTIIECAELLEHFRYKTEKECEELFDSPKTRNEICRELADILYCILRMAQKYDIDLVTEFDKKMIENNQKYPVEKSRGSCKKYTEYQ